MRRRTLILFHHSLAHSGTERSRDQFLRSGAARDGKGRITARWDRGPTRFDLTNPLADPFVCVEAQRTYGFLSAVNKNEADWQKCVEQVAEEARIADFVLRHAEADIVLVWHQWNSLISLIREASWRRGIPCAVIHEGMLPKTLTLDTKGMMAEAGCVGALAEPHEAVALRKAEEIIGRICEERLDRKPGSAMSIAESFASSRPRPPAGRWCSMPGSTTGNRVCCRSTPIPCSIRRIIRTPWMPWCNCSKRRRRTISTSCSSRIPTCIRAISSIRIRASSRRANRTPSSASSTPRVTVTILSSLAYIALCHGRPTVLLGRNTLSGAGAAYELTDRRELAALLRAAIAADDLPQRLGRFRAHVAALLKDHLYPYGRPDGMTLKSYADTARAILALGAAGEDAAARGAHPRLRSVE